MRLILIVNMFFKLFISEENSVYIELMALVLTGSKIFHILAGSVDAQLL